MPTIKVPYTKSTITSSGITSSIVSSSVSGNMNLIQSKIKEKSNEYINIKNAVNLLEKYSNWNGYIKLYTEVESNFDINDIVYITYITPVTGSTIFNLDNNFNNDTKLYYDNPFDENVSKYSFGYKVLYVNKYKNELVINRYYNDITPGYSITNQCLSKISCRKGVFFERIADGVVFYGDRNLSCNILNGDFSILQGMVSGLTYNGSEYVGSYLSGATVSSVGLSTISDENGFYSLNVPIGNNIIKCTATGFITNTINKYINLNQINILNITLTGGTNLITIFSSTDTICPGGTITFYSHTVGYDGPVQYQWKIYRTGNWINTGTNNSIFSYNSFQNNDIMKCEVRDDIDIVNGTFTSSNEIEVFILTANLTIVSDPPSVGSIVVISGGTLVTFTANAICYDYPVYQWYLNTVIPVGTDNNVYSSSTLQNNDTVHCVVNGIPSNYILISVGILITTTTTTGAVTTTTTGAVTTTTTNTTLPIESLCLGLLYNWYAATSEIAPTGWHVPTLSEFDTLNITIEYSGGSLKQTGLNYWNSPNEGSTNFYGFNGIGSSERASNGSWLSPKIESSYQTFDYIIEGAYYKHSFGLRYDTDTFSPYYSNSYQMMTNVGNSIRLIKDDSIDPETLTDYDGNIYPTVKIGNQVWMAQELRVTHYNNGDQILILPDYIDWSGTTSGACCALFNSYYFINNCGGYIITTTTTTTEAVTTTTTTIISADLMIYVTTGLFESNFYPYQLDMDTYALFTVDWGDGIIESNSFYHEYSTVDNYIINIYFVDKNNIGYIYFSGPIITDIEFINPTSMSWCQINYTTITNFNNIGLLTQTQLNYITLQYNYLVTDIDFSEITLLSELEVYGTSIINVITSGNTLVGLTVASTSITDLNVLNNTSLNWIQIYGNSLLTNLDLSNNINLTEIYIDNMPITDLILSNYSAIDIEINNININSIDLHNLTSSTLYIQSCTGLTTITNFTAVDNGYFYFDINALTEDIVNTILIECDSKFTYTGSVFPTAIMLEGGTNACPTGLGVIAKDSLNSKNRITTTTDCITSTTTTTEITTTTTTTTICFGLLYNSYVTNPIRDIEYGLIYNWITASDVRFVGANAHLPSETEWGTLYTYLGGASSAGQFLKESGTTHWNSGSFPGNNSSGFSARGGGQLSSGGVLNSFKSLVRYWTSTEHLTYNAHTEQILLNSYSVTRSFNIKETGNYVRLIVDDLTLLSDGDMGTYVDYDGNIYPTVKIGTQVWTTRDSIVKHFNDGTDIPTYAPSWLAFPGMPQWIYPNNTQSDAYIESKNIAPTGWHVPTWSDWNTLCDGLGTFDIDRWIGVGAILKAEPFNGLLAGERFPDGSFGQMYTSGNWWSNTNYSESYKYSLQISSGDDALVWFEEKMVGFSIRLIKDDSSDPGTVTDYDGNVYSTVTIGSQVWTTSNLYVKHYNNGEIISEITDNDTWITLLSGATCSYNNDWSYSCTAPEPTTTTTTEALTTTTTTTEELTTTTTTTEGI